MHDAEGSGGREHAAERPQSCGVRGGHRRAVALVALVAAQTLAAVGAQPSGSKPHIGGGDWDDRFGPVSIQSDIARYARQQQAREAQRAAAAPVSTPYAASGSWAGGWGLHADKVIAAPGVTVVPSGKSPTPHPRRQAGSKEQAAAPSSRLDVHSETAGASGKGPGAARAHQSPTAAPHVGGETWMEQDIEREMEDDGSITGEPDATPDSSSEHASSYAVPRPGEKNARKPRHGEPAAGAPRTHPRGNHS